MNMNRTNVYETQDAGLQAYMSKVFMKMFIGLGITAGVAFLGYQNLLAGGFLYKMLATSRSMPFILLMVELWVVISLSRNITSMSTSKANTLFYVYAAITGITFSTLPFAYGQATVFNAFLMGAVMFGSCAVIGMTTHTDLTKFSGLLSGALIALVVSTLLGLFFEPFRGLWVSYFGVLLFLGLTAWDMQQIKSIYYQTNGYDTVTENMAVFGSLRLYLDFINIFLYVLRIMGSGNNRD